MIWHIFKKDWKLLWPLVLLAAFAQAISAMFWWLGDHDLLPNTLRGMLQLFPHGALLASAILALAVIQNDPLPGDREDWLVRPIRRFDLLVAKILFVLLAIITPVFTIGALEALSDKFSLMPSLGAALGQSLAVLVLICLPAMALGAITRHAMEAFAGAAAIMVLIGLYAATAIFLGMHPILRGSGLGWWSSAVMAGVVVAGGLIILVLQYLGRYTEISRILAVPFILLAISSMYLPWQPFFFAQMLMSRDANGGGVTIGFDPSLKRSPRTARGAGS